MAVDAVDINDDETRHLKLYSPESGDSTTASAGDVLKEIGRHLNCLEDNNRAIRKRSIQGISNDTLKLDPAILDRVFCEIHKTVLRLFHDPVEKCRELSIAYTRDVLRRSQHSESHLPYVVAVLVERLAGKEVVEPCEEIRLQLVEMLVEIVETVSDKIAPYVEDIVKILGRTLLDAFPDLKKMSCACASLLAKSAPAYFHQCSEQLIDPLTKGLSHQHSRVRVAFITATGDVVRFGNNKSVDDVICHLAQRMFDRAATVRQAVVDVIGNWILELPDRYSFWHRFIPLLLAAFADEMPEIAESARAFWHDAGVKYEKENEEDLKDKINYPKPMPAHYPKGFERPNLGCRSLIYSSLIRILPAAVNDLKDWVADTRKMAARLMFYLILQSEDNINQHLPGLLDGLYRGSRDEEAEVVTFALRTSELVGYFSTPDVWWPLLLEALRKTTGAAFVVRVLSGALRGTEKTPLLEVAPDVVRALMEPEIMWCFASDTQRALLSCVVAIVVNLGADVNDVAQLLFLIVVAVESLTNSPEVAEDAGRALEELARAEQLDGDVSALLRRHAGFALEFLKSDHEYWNALSPERRLFESLMLRAIASPAALAGDDVAGGEDVVADIIDEVVPIIVVNLNPEKDLELRQHLFGLLIRLFTNAGSIESRRVLLGDYAEILLTDAVMPNLVWKAGRTAAVLRTTCVACLWQLMLTHALSKRAMLKHEEEIVKQIVGTMEDDSPDTRQISCKVLKALIESCGEDLNIDRLHKLYPDFLKRMDDVDDEVRAAALSIFESFFHNIAMRPDFDTMTFRGHYEDIYKGLLIHMDDPRQSFQELVCSVLLQVGSVSTKELVSSCEAAMHKHRTPKYCQQILDKWGNI